MTYSPKRITRQALMLVVVLLATTIIVPAQGDRTRRIRFARGRTTKVIKDAVIRATQDHYLLQARRGQTLTVHITSLEDNAVLDVYAPGGRILAGDTTDWTGSLPRSGDVVISVSATRGNATYALEVTVR